jgi:hypothetical protein
VYDTGPVRPTPDACVVSGAMCTPRPEACEARERCGNGLDDNCNGMVDEACPCIPGTVQDCFLGPPGRRGAGQCSGGTQRCLGTGEFGNWGACDGALAPSAEVCDNLDNDCDGCVDEGLCCNADLNCPGAGDVRVPEGRPFQAYPLRGRLFYPGEARAWRWTVRGGPCDAVLPRPTFQLVQADQRDAAFVPTLSGDYTVTLTVTTATGQTLTCTFVVHIAGPGVRVELCWDTSTTVDLDLYVHDPRNMGPWFDGAGSPIQSTNNNSCNWSNCEANIRGTRGRVSWGYGNSPLAACENGPLGDGWRRLGHCANPRLDIDNNLVKASGVPENMNVDAPSQRRALPHHGAKLLGPRGAPAGQRVLRRPAARHRRPDARRALGLHGPVGQHRHRGHVARGRCGQPGGRHGRDDGVRGGSAAGAGHDGRVLRHPQRPVVLSAA